MLAQEWKTRPTYQQSFSTHHQIPSWEPGSLAWFLLGMPLTCPLLHIFPSYLLPSTHVELQWTLMGLLPSHLFFPSSMLKTNSFFPWYRLQLCDFSSSVVPTVMRACLGACKAQASTWSQGPHWIPLPWIHTFCAIEVILLSLLYPVSSFHLSHHLPVSASFSTVSIWTISACLLLLRPKVIWT